MMTLVEANPVTAVRSGAQDAEVHARSASRGSSCMMTAPHPTMPDAVRGARDR